MRPPRFGVERRSLGEGERFRFLGDLGFDGLDAACDLIPAGLGILNDMEVSVRYADGTADSQKTNSEGVLFLEIGLWSEEGNFVDLEFETELRVHKLRVFLVTEHASTPNGAWQRLVNLGYVSEEEPKAEPEI